MRVLVAGCGYVGSALASALAAEGEEVFGLRRSVARLPEGVAPVAADLAEPASLRDLPERLDAVVYAAGPGEPGEAAYRRAFVEGLANLKRALAGRPAPPRRLLFVTSTGVYGQDDGSWVDERSPTEPSRATGHVLLEGEALAHAEPIPGTVLRLAGIYGPGRTRLVERVRSGEARTQRDPPRYTNRIHRDDAAGALRHLLRLEAPEPVYLGVDREPAPEQEVHAWLAERLGVPPPPAAERPPGDASRAPGRNKRCSSARLQASGYRFQYPTYREGYAALLEEAGAGG